MSLHGPPALPTTEGKPPRRMQRALRELGRSPGLAESHLENGFTQQALLPVTETVRSQCLTAVPRGRGRLQAQKHGPLWSEPKGPGALENAILQHSAGGYPICNTLLG